MQPNKDRYRLSMSYSISIRLDIPYTVRMQSPKILKSSGTDATLKNLFGEEPSLYNTRNHNDMFSYSFDNHDVLFDKRMMGFLFRLILLTYSLKHIKGLRTKGI